jgi:hypothetical protein
LLVLAGPAAALEITPTFTDAEGAEWTEARRAVVHQAIADYQSAILDEGAMAVEVQFGEMDQAAMWYTHGEPPTGRTVRPWSRGLRHVIVINAALAEALWYDPTPDTDDDVPADRYDALTLIRHEMGHMMGHRDGYGIEGWGTRRHRDLWMALIDEQGVFDAAGLNVRMARGNWGHWAGEGLMHPRMLPGRRYSVGRTVEMLAAAYDYELAAAPETQPADAPQGEALEVAAESGLAFHSAGRSSLWQWVGMAALLGGYVVVFVALARALRRRAAGA